MLSDRDIVCVSVMDWDWPFWTSRQHLMTEFARTNRVLYVDPPLTIASDYLGARHDARLGRKLRRTLRGDQPREVADNLRVWSPPPTIPFNRITNRALFASVLAFNQRIFRTSLRRTLQALGVRDPLLWVSFNVYYGDAVVGRLGEAQSVYHCTDEIGGFPGYSRFIGPIEARLAARSDIVIATSEVLRDTKAAYNPRTYFVPNAADVDLFKQAVHWQQALPADLTELPRPRAGFVGQVEYRFDDQLLRYAAEQLPNWSFALVGPVQKGCRAEETLRQVPNVHFLGLKTRQELPAYMAGLDVALIPYKVDRLGRGLYPLKVHEYLAAGKPVVATPLPSMQSLADRLYLAEDGPAFVSAVQQAVTEDSPARKLDRARVAEQENWHARADQISTLLATVPEHPPLSETLSFSAFARLGRAFSKRPRAWPNRLAYRLLGDLNLHRRVRSAHALAAVGADVTHAAAPVDVLDAGCGEGALSLAIAREYPSARVVGVDIDDEGVAACNVVAQKIGASNLRFERADVTALPFEAAFDLVTCVDVLEHVVEDEAGLRSFWRALRPGGRLVVHVPLRHQLQRRCLPTHREHEVEDHVRDEYLAEEIVSRVEGAGFAVERLDRTFGASGELGFELNTLFAGSRIGAALAMLTYPLTLLLGYLDVSRPRASSAPGNSFLVVARKQAA
jgi:SAM-dependent methyltransferase/glycosyltransferase involved in cell wall biosynthesis